MGGKNIRWLETITSESHRRIAIKLNTSQSTVSRAAQTDAPNPALVRDIARIYGADVITALYTTNFITSEELSTHRSITPLSQVTNTELLQELLRRERT